MTYRIYALNDQTGAPRYVGQTAAPLALRLADHLRVRGHSARANWIREMLDSGHEIGVVQLEEVHGTRRDAYAAETRWIRQLRAMGHSLLNVP